MTIFTTLLFTVHIISSTVETLSSKNCANLQCDPKEQNETLCMEVILEPSQRTVYIPFNGCAIKEFKCSLRNNEKMSSVSLSNCFQKTPPMQRRRAARMEYYDTGEVMTELNKEQNNQEQCPKKCPKSSKMVCARCAHGIYRTFLSACHVRQYQCKSNEKFELVSHRACYGSAPFVMGENHPRFGSRSRYKYLGGWKRGKYTVPLGERWTPKPTVDVPWPTRHPKHRSSTTKTRRTRKSKTTRKTKQKMTTTPASIATKHASITTTPVSITTTPAFIATKRASITTTPASITTTPASITTVDNAAQTKYLDYDENDTVITVEVDICPKDEDQESIIPVPKVCSNTTNYYKEDFMKVDLQPDFIEEGSPVWVVLHKGRKITSAIRADAGLVVGCEAYAGLDYSGTVIVKSKEDSDFIGLVFGYRSNSQFYLVAWKSTPDKYWRGWPTVVTADAGLHIKRVDSKTGPGAYLRNALYSTESVKDEVTLLWQDPMKQGWEHLVNYNWQLLHRPHIGLIRLKVFRGNTLLVDSGNIYDKVTEGGRIGVYAFSQENIEWFQMDFKCNDKVPVNLMPELPPDLQKISEVDYTYNWSNKTTKPSY